MKSNILFLSCILNISLINTGVSINTVVDTPEGLKEIKTLKVGDKIFCCNPNLGSEEGFVSTIEEIEATSVVEITTTDGVTITVAADQRLFVTHKWVQANQLTLEDVLCTKDHTFVGITSIRHLQTPTTLRFITVDKNPNFWAAENGVLIHNGYWGATVGFWGGVAATNVAIEGACGAIGTGVGFVAGPLVGAGVYKGLSLTVSPFRIVAAKTVGLACGVWLGAATGPI